MDEAGKARHDEIDELLSSTFNAILRIEQKSLDNRITSGLSISEIHTIDAVGYQGKSAMSAIAARLDVTLATLTIAVGKLAEKGYLVRERDAEDKRKVLVSLTSTGRQVFRAHRLFHRKMADEALAGLSKEEERVLLTALSKVNAFFREQAV